MLNPNVYFEAADMIECDGLWQAKYESHGRECTYTALIASPSRHEHVLPYVETFNRLLNNLVSHHNQVLTMVNWNDDPNRTQEEVVLTLRLVGLAVKEEQDV